MSWVILKARAAYEMRLAGEVAEVVVETAGAGVGAIDDRVDDIEAVLVIGEGGDLFKLARPSFPIER